MEWFKNESCQAFNFTRSHERGPHCIDPTHPFLSQVGEWLSVRRELEHVNSAWMIMPVSNFVAALVGPMLDVDYRDAMQVRGLWYKCEILCWDNHIIDMTWLLGGAIEHGLTIKYLLLLIIMWPLSSLLPYLVIVLVWVCIRCMAAPLFTYVLQGRS